MPIYAYKCGSCGHAKDVLQKMSADPLTTCPECGAETFTKQLTAAGFQLKGSGWYVTDFRGGNSGAGAAPASGATDAPAAASDSQIAAPAAAKDAPASTAAPAAAAAAPAASAAPSAS
ncbi:FmdB family zinc ribbon protein [Simplicispira psychrophila]|uniref:FmdB family zinc ribbon protein n=1 Tax=Simplicispira psychrophila TaxID=80882 RepID=UPI0004869DC2|nr:FmdB family zinc ribbon protein [Simplicispira psychrophila]